MNRVDKCDISIWCSAVCSCLRLELSESISGRKDIKRLDIIGVYETDQAVGIERRNGVLDGLKEYGIHR